MSLKVTFGEWSGVAHYGMSHAPIAIFESALPGTPRERLDWGTPGRTMVVQAQAHSTWAHLVELLKCALGVEASVIPVYLTALHSVRPERPDVRRVLRGIVVEEMLHYALVRNLMVGLGAPFANHGGVRSGPFPVKLQPSDPDVPALLLDPAPLSVELLTKTLLPLERGRRLTAGDGAEGLGDALAILYSEAKAAIVALDEEYPTRLYHRSADAWPLVEGYRLVAGNHPGSGSLFAVTDRRSALRVIETITLQSRGEGAPPGIATPNSHAVRLQLLLETSDQWVADVRELRPPEVEEGDPSPEAQLHCLYLLLYRYLWAILDQRYLAGRPSGPEWVDPADRVIAPGSHDEVVWSGLHAVMANLLPVIADRLAELGLRPTYAGGDLYLAGYQLRERILALLAGAAGLWPAHGWDAAEPARIERAIKNLPPVYIRPPQER